MELNLNVRMQRSSFLWVTCNRKADDICGLSKFSVCLLCSHPAYYFPFSTLKLFSRQFSFCPSKNWVVCTESWACVFREVVSHSYSHAAMIWLALFFLWSIHLAKVWTQWEKEASVDEHARVKAAILCCMNGCLPSGSRERMEKKRNPLCKRVIGYWRTQDYVRSPSSKQCLGRLRAEGPLLSETWSWDSQPRVVCLGSPLQAHADVWCGGSVRCPICGCLRGLFPQAIAVVHMPAVVRAAKTRSRRGGAARVPQWAMTDVSRCVTVLPFSSSLSCIWNLAGNRHIWAEKVVSAWAVNWPAFVSLSQFYCCFSTTCAS